MLKNYWSDSLGFKTMIKSNSFRWIVIFLLLYFSITVIHAEHRGRILINGKVFTGEKGGLKEAVVIIGNKIAYVGQRKVALQYNKSNKFFVSDLSGKTVLPGFHDGDVDFALGALLLNKNYNFRGLNLESIIHRLRNEKKRVEKGEVIRGFFFEHLLYKNKNYPNKYDLDKVSTDNPIVILGADNHYAWVNSKALHISGIEKGISDIPGGTIERFGDGEPTGILKDRALKLLNKLTKNIKKIDKDTLQKAIKYAHRFGITSVTSKGDLYFLQLLRKLEASESLNLRFNLVLPAENVGSYLIKKIYFNTKSTYVNIKFLSIVIDGDFFTSDAAMFTEYVSNDNYGYLRIRKHELEEILELFRQNGIMGSFHVEGDRGVRLVIESIEKKFRKHTKVGYRHRIENFKYILDDDIKKLRLLSIVPVIRPASFSGKSILLDYLVGERKALNALRLVTLKNSDVKIAFGSGWPGEEFDPKKGLFFAVFRKDIGSKISNFGWFAEERISIEDAIKFYTSGSAYAAGQEDKIGTLKKGKFADITILDKDIFSDNINLESDFRNVSVIETIVSGKTVYKKGDVNDF